MGKYLGATTPPIGERTICLYRHSIARFQAIGDTTEHDGFGYHGLSHAWSRIFTRFVEEIGSPKFWPKETLEPILAQYKKDHLDPPQRPTPIWQGVVKFVPFYLLSRARERLSAFGVKQTWAWICLDFSLMIKIRHREWRVDVTYRAPMTF